MKRLIGSILCGFVLMLSSGEAAAAAHTKADAKALIQKAVAFIKANGKAKAVAEFNNPKGQFTNGDLYVLAYELDGTSLANANIKLVGKNLIDLKDSDGTPLVKGMIDTAKAGGGWYDYKWNNPATKTIQGKTTYVELIDGAWMIGCGIYK
jgi:cytochrome c